jgi:hypothetical protein
MLLLSKWGYYIRLWLARRWCDPQLAVLADRYGSVLITSERYGKLILPLYHAVWDGEVSARVMMKLERMTEERDYWKREAERQGEKEPK